LLRMECNASPAARFFAFSHGLDPQVACVFAGRDHKTQRPRPFLEGARAR
jgi:hypothetical protein